MKNIEINNKSNEKENAEMKNKSKENEKYRNQE